MMNTFDTSLFDKAASFAISAHAGIERKGTGYPYAVHLMEAAEIVATMTSDREMLAAALLHDVLEDTDHTEDELRSLFGERVLSLVKSETDIRFDDKTSAESWRARKEFAVERLSKAAREEKIVALGDKLSNMRAIARDYRREGDTVWNKFHVGKKSEIGWYYNGLKKAMASLDDTEAYAEFSHLVDEVFSFEA